MAKLGSSQTKEAIQAKLDEAFSGDEYNEKGFSGVMANDAKSTSLKIANMYIDLISSLMENAPETEHWDFATPEALKLASDYRNGQLKDKNSLFTPNKYHYSTSFEKAIEAVNETLNLPKDVVTTLV